MEFEQIRFYFAAILICNLLGILYVFLWIIVNIFRGHYEKKRIAIRRQQAEMYGVAQSERTQAGGIE